MAKIEVSKSYPYPIEAVWEALTNSEALGEWLMPNNFEPIVGHRFQFQAEPGLGFDGRVECEVIEVDAPHKLSISWSGGPVKDTRVSFVLQSIQDGQGTDLHFLHNGFKGLSANLVRLILSTGWRSKLLNQNLPEYLNKKIHLLANRRKAHEPEPH